MEKKSKKSILIGITSLFLVMILLLGLTYAYYRTRIIGNESNEPSINITSKKLEIVYSDEEATVNMPNEIEPGFIATKTFYVTNTGDSTVNFSIKLDNVVNTFERNDWIYKLYTGTETTESNLLKSGMISNAAIQAIDPSVEIVASNDPDNNPTTQTYTLIFEYVKLDDVDQSEDMGATLSLRVNIGDELGLLSDSNDIKVGDYVYYNYLEKGEHSRLYTTPTVASGKSIYTEAQTFDSANDAKINGWRILSISDEGIELVADVPKNDEYKGVYLYGDKGWVNGSTILNEMADSLYSSEYGTASSLDVDDIIRAFDYPQVKIYYDASGNKVEIPADVNKTVLDLETELGVTLTNRIAPSNLSSINDLQIDILKINDKAFSKYTNGDEEKIILKGILNNANITDPYCPAYWLASKAIDLNFKNNILKYRQYFIMNDKLMGRHLYNSQGEEQTDVLEEAYKLRPVVKLNNNVYLDSEKIQIDVNNDGQLDVQAWTLALN